MSCGRVRIKANGWYSRFGKLRYSDPEGWVTIEILQNGEVWLCSAEGMVRMPPEAVDTLTHLLCAAYTNNVKHVKLIDDKEDGDEQD